jgi:type IV pilus assembly protein PilY1
MPSETGDTNIDDDTYVAVMGGGMGNTFICSGSNLFIVDLESGSYNGGTLSPTTVRSSDDDADAAVATPGPGSLYGWKENNGPINIIDTDPTGLNPGLSNAVDTEFGSDIANAVPASPVVITPDVAKGIQWTGALVYVNDLEGKITKINLTNQKKPATADYSELELYEQTTLFHLDASIANDRYSYHSMDATIGKDTNDFWLFGGTGNFERIGSTGNESGDWMENILYGVKDRDYPFFRRLNGENSPIKYSSGSFPKKAAHEAANRAKSIENNNTDTVKCTVDTTLQGPHSGCIVTRKNDAWVIYLDQPDGEPLIATANKFRKVSAAPTVYKGQVYFPIYEPDKESKCGLGRALICTADDECGNNNSILIENEDYAFIDGDDCLFIRRGILSELVIFGDKLFANVAGPSDTEDTLVTILAGAGDITTYRRSWRENY